MTDDLIKKVFDKILNSKSSKKAREYGRIFMSGAEDPKEFIENYESRSWVRRSLLPGANNQRLKYLVAAKLMNKPGPLAF